MTDNKKDFQDPLIKPAIGTASPLRPTNPFQARNFGKQKFNQRASFSPTTFKQTQHKG